MINFVKHRFQGTKKLWWQITLLKRFAFVYQDGRIQYIDIKRGGRPV